TKGISLSRQLRLLKNVLTAAKGTDVIYAQGTVTVGYACLKAKKLLKKRLVLKFVGDEVWENYRKNPKHTDSLETFYENQKKENQILTIHREVLNGADAIVTPSQYLKEFLVKYHHIKEEKIHI